MSSDGGKDVRPKIRIGETHNRALCCNCGQMRSVKATFQAPRSVPDLLTHDEAHLAQIQARGHYLDAEPGFRKTGYLRCSHCGEVTRHAILCDCDKAEHRDRAEECERATPSAAGSNATGDPVVTRSGFTVIIVEQLGKPAQIVNTTGPRLLLLDADLSCEERMRIMSTLMPVSDA